MTKETEHLIGWWIEWACRLLRTTWHIVNRRAYRRWKNQNMGGGGPTAEPFGVEDGF